MLSTTEHATASEGTFNFLQCSVFLENLCSYLLRAPPLHFYILSGMSCL